MHLEEGFLKHVLRRGAITEKSHEKVIQLTLITQDEHGELGLVAGAIFGEELLVGRLFAPADARSGTLAVGRARGVIRIQLAAAVAHARVAFTLVRGDVHLHLHSRPARVKTDKVQKDMSGPSLCMTDLSITRNVQL